MKKILLLLLVALAVSCSQGEKQTSQEAAPSEKKEEVALDERAAMYRASVYKDKEHNDWLATLNKAEQVVLLEEVSEEVEIKGKKEKLARVRLSDDSEGYIRMRYLADKAVVITDDEVPVFNRNNKTSGQHSVLPKGTVAFVVDQKANWLKVTVGELSDGTKVYNRWIEKGYSEDRGLVSDAVRIEDAGKILSGEKDGDTEAAHFILEELANKGNEMSFVAQAYLEEDTAQEPYEYPEDAVLARVTATNLKIRTEPNVEAEELKMAPQNSVAAILEEQEDEVEIGGMSGRWMKINFEGTQGWAFGAFLEKM